MYKGRVVFPTTDGYLLLVLSSHMPQSTAKPRSCFCLTEHKKKQKSNEKVLTPESDFVMKCPL